MPQRDNTPTPRAPGADTATTALGPSNILALHHLRHFSTRAHPSGAGFDSVTRCACDWVSYDGVADESAARELHAAHQLSELTNQGYSIVSSTVGTCVDDPWGTHRWVQTDFGDPVRSSRRCVDCRLSTRL